MTDEVWRKPFLQFMDYLEGSERLTRLTYRGIRGVGTLIAVRGILNEGRDGGPRIEPQDEELQTLSAAEIAADFPLLHAHSVMGEWGALECLIEDLVEAWITHKPDTLGRPEFARLKVPLANFLGMSERDRTRFLVTEVQRELKVDLKSGATKFEKILDAIGLGGAVDPRMRDALYEIQNVRNVWAHRGGVADRRLVEACPTLGFKEGDKVLIGREKYFYYRNAMLAYAATILNRCQRADGLEGVEPLKLDLPGFEGLV